MGLYLGNRPLAMAGNLVSAFIGTRQVWHTAITPGDVVPLTHDDPLARPHPTTRWDVDTYATFTDGRYRWTGTAWTAYVTWTTARTNLHPDPRASTMRLGPTDGTAVIVLTHGEAGAPDGRSFRRFTFNTESVGTNYLGDRQDPIERIPVTAGQVVTWSVWVRASHAGGYVRPEIVWHTTGSSLVPAGATTAGSNVALAPDTWTLLTLTTPVNQAAGNAAGRVVSVLGGDPAAVPAGTAIDVAQRLFEVANSALPYFDGDTPDTETADHSWTGTPHASTSILRTPAT